MSDQHDDTVPNEEQNQEVQPGADSSTVEETASSSQSEETPEESQVEESGEDQSSDEDEAEAGEEEIDREEYIPVSRHKRILEKARQEARAKESKGDAQVSSDDQEEGEELTASAQKLIDQRVSEGVQARLDAKDKEAEEERKTQIFNAEVSRLSKEHDGKDGLPKFDSKKVMEYGRKVGIYNLEAAYDHMHAKEREEQLRTKMAKEYAENPPAASDRPGSSRSGGEATSQQNERVDMRDRNQVTARIRKARQQIEAGQS